MRWKFSSRPYNDVVGANKSVLRHLNANLERQPLDAAQNRFVFIISWISEPRKKRIRWILSGYRNNGVGTKSQFCPHNVTWTQASSAICTWCRAKPVCIYHLWDKWTQYIENPMNFYRVTTIPSRGRKADFTSLGRKPRAPYTRCRAKPLCIYHLWDKWIHSVENSVKFISLPQ